jgi:hypothetical protein
MQLHGQSWPSPQCVVMSESQEEYKCCIQKKTNYSAQRRTQRKAVH